MVGPMTYQFSTGTGTRYWYRSRSYLEYLY